MNEQDLYADIDVDSGYELSNDSVTPMTMIIFPIKFLGQGLKFFSEYDFHPAIDVRVQRPSQLF